ncbi:MAG: NHL repeat-containing protein [Treponema sp.]|nr:NHL repeat-containing protein [Treponema sp.]
MKLRNLAIVALLILFLPQALVAQASGQGPVTGGGGIDGVDAAREFRLGIQAFNRYAFNEAVLSLERALAFRPGEAVILDWLGRAYFRSGFEAIALSQWRAAADAYGRRTEMGQLMTGRMETIANRRLFLPFAEDDVRYVRSGSLPGSSGGAVLYRQPTSVLPQADGSTWVVAFGSNELVRIGVNGTVVERRRGPVQGFDRPYDMARGLDGRLYVSEYGGGRVSILSPQGQWLAYIGSTGRENGKFVGPKNLAVDEAGYLYVVDFGNLRVSKFSPDGDFILSFGTRGNGFAGLKSPTGMAISGNRIFVSDLVERQIFTFDTNGNYLGVLAGGFLAPEGLRLALDGRLLLADGNRVLLVDPETAIVRELGLAGNQRTRIVNAGLDANGNILAVDFDGGEVALLTRFDDMAAGLFVQVERVFAERFPLVTLEVRVEDRLRRPIVGLGALNFVVSEGGTPVAGQEFLMPAYRVNHSEVSILIERSPETFAMRDTLDAAVADIASALGSQGRIRSVVSAGEQPFMERHEGDLRQAARGDAAGFSGRWRFDLGLRLAATDLLAGGQKRSVVYVTSGGLGQLAFEQYSLSEMAGYLANNGIIFNAVIVGSTPPSAELLYLTERTGGQALSLYRPEGIRGMIESIAETPSGLYTISFRSGLFSDFGRAWLPVEVEVYLMERSGRDIGGYFPPLE